MADCENKKLWDKWICRAGNAIHRISSGVYAVKVVLVDSAGNIQDNQDVDIPGEIATPITVTDSWVSLDLTDKIVQVSGDYIVAFRTDTGSATKIFNVEPGELFPPEGFSFTTVQHKVNDGEATSSELQVVQKVSL